MAQPEAILSAKIVKWLNAQPYTVARKRHVTIYGVTGDPDIYGCVLGRHFEIEVKMPGKKPTSLQESRLEQWRVSGAKITVVYSLEEAQKFYLEICNV
jgi:hypothetical protein